MKLSYVIAIAAVVLPCATALIVGYLHRKQMRQIEAYRLNPEIGLKPPSNALFKFFKKHLTSIIGQGIPLIGILWGMLGSAPITRWKVYMIASGWALIAYNWAVDVIYRIDARRWDQLSEIVKLINQPHAELHSRTDPASN
jgi:hypothetical protein